LAGREGFEVGGAVDGLEKASGRNVHQKRKQERRMWLKVGGRRDLGAAFGLEGGERGAVFLFLE
jgi:hypothetical protein